MTIREATADDQYALLIMARHFLDGTPYGVLTGAVDDAQLVWFIDQVLGRGVALLAVDADQVVGLIVVEALANEVNGVLFANEVAWWVEPGYRLTSIGRQLIEAAEAWARGRGLVMLKMVAPASSAIGSFYERMGYAPVETAYQKALVS